MTEPNATPELADEAPLPSQQATTDELAAALAADHSAETTTLPAPDWTALNPLLAFEAGKAGIHLERSASVEIHLAEQKVVYERILAARPELLVQALLDRDRVIAQFGRETADGRMGGRLLREFVRAALASADRMQDPQRLQKFLEQALGAEPADAKLLRQKGTTL